MAMALQTVAALDPETKKALIGGALGLINSAPIIAFGAAMVVNLQWNLEHLAIKRERVTETRQVILSRPFAGESKFQTEDVPTDKWKYSLVRLDTITAADVDHKDPNKTPLAPPLMSSAVRLADNGLDVAASAARLAEKQIEVTSQKGAIQGVIEFFLGSG